MHSLIRVSVPLNCVVLHMTGLSCWYSVDLTHPMQSHQFTSISSLHFTASIPPPPRCHVCGRLETRNTGRGFRTVNGELFVNHFEPIHSSALKKICKQEHSDVPYICCVCRFSPCSHLLSFILIQSAVGCRHSWEWPHLQYEPVLNTLQVTWGGWHKGHS